MSVKTIVTVPSAATCSRGRLVSLDRLLELLEVTVKALPKTSTFAMGSDQCT